MKETLSNFILLIDHAETHCAHPKWNSYDAVAITPEICEKARAFLRALPEYAIDPEMVCPNSRGGFTFEFNPDSSDAWLIIELDPQGFLLFATETEDNESDKYGFDKTIPMTILRKISRLNTK